MNEFKANRVLDFGFDISSTVRNLVIRDGHKISPAGRNDKKG
jgi:hypothetical protein